jgi:hypothetical protein
LKGGTPKRPFLSAVLCAALAAATNGFIPSFAVIGAATATALVVAPGQAEARSYARSSGGYTRSPGSFSSRTPSFSSGGYGRSRTPSFSFGSPPSPSDRAISRQGSGAALNAFQGNRNEGFGSRTPSFAAPAQRPSGQGYAGGGFGNGRWRLPSYAANSPARYGAWNSAFLWFLLGSLSQQGHAAFFYNNASDPGVQAWRAEANRKAATDPALREQLNALDQRVDALDGTPRDPGAVPAGVNPGGASAAGHGIGTTLLVVLAGCLLLLWLWWGRRRPATATAPAATKGPDMSSPISAAIGIVRHKLSGEGYTPSLFRVGMTVTLDPAPFVLAAGKTKVTMPRALGGGDRSLISVERVGTLQIGAVALTRLYLPSDGFFQLHLDPAGHPDECRYFSLLDEITPASRDEWGFWLDDTEGVIGLPDFQAKDGKQYWRAWSPGQSRLPPVEATETIQSLQGETTRRLRAMLYGVPTGLAAPAPPTEYIFVAAVEQSGQAFVEVLAGIDFNPAALSLA